MTENLFKLLILPSVPNMQQVVDKFSFPVQLTKGRFLDVEMVFHEGRQMILHKGIDIRNFSFIWLCSSWSSRDLAYAIQLYLDKNNIPNTCVEKGTSKITDQMVLTLNGIATPDTLFLGHKNIEKSLTRIKKVCGYPIIIKDTKGSRGADTFHAASEKELIEKIKLFPKHKACMLQKFIPNEYDWGIMVANGVVVSGEKSYPCEGEFRNNACNGAKEVFVEPNEIPDQIKALAIQASSALNLSWSRTDIIIDKISQKPYVLEVNRLPGITSETSEVEGAYVFLSSQLAAFLK